MRFHKGQIPPEKVKRDDFAFKGRLLPMRAAGYCKELIGGEGAENFEGGAEDWNPYDYCQHPAMVPRKTFEMLPDNRVLNLYKKQLRVDFIGIRLVTIAGNTFLILSTFIKQ
jgi:hypothetical protein